MEEKILSTIVSSLIKELLTECKSLFSDANDELKQFFNKGLKKYLEKQRDSYSYIKTLLKGNTPVYLYDIYFPLKIYYQTKTHQKENIDTNNVNNVFKRSNYITIIGDAGSGKSTLVKHLFINSIKEKYAIPILIELRYLNDYKNSFEQYIYEKIFENKLSQNVSILDRLLQNGKFVFFLDGFDELASDVRQKVIISMNGFIDCYNANKFIITTRPYSDIENLQLFHNYYVMGLEAEDVDNFIFQQLKQEQELANKIVASIKINRSKYIDSFLRNPLLLSLYILTFQSDASVPNKRYIFYRRVINALFSEHDSKTKLGFVREKSSKLNQEQFEEVLKLFSFISYFENKFLWDIDYAGIKLRFIKSKLADLSFDNVLFVKDLKSAIALWVEDNGIMSFAHKSLQEYFGALFIKHLGEKESKKIYEKIIRIFATNNSSEHKNFLTLCEEMDTINFNKFYLLPLLTELRQIVKKESEDLLVLSFIQFFSSGIAFSEQSDKKSHSQIEILINNDLVYKSIYIHLPFTQKLYDILSKKLSLPILQSLNSIPAETNDVTPRIMMLSRHDTKIESIRYIKFDKPLSPELSSLLFSSVLDIAKEFSNFIDKRIKEVNKFIQDSENLNRELIELI